MNKLLTQQDLSDLEIYLFEAWYTSIRRYYPGWLREWKLHLKNELPILFNGTNIWIKSNNPTKKYNSTILYRGFCKEGDAILALTKNNSKAMLKKLTNFLKEKLN